jgi:hypothetical protein
MFFVSLDRFEVSVHEYRVRLLLNLHFRVEFFDFRVSAYRAYSVSVAGI